MYNYSGAIKILDGWKNLNQVALDMLKRNRKKEEGELHNMNNLENEFYPWLAEKIGVKLGEKFILQGLNRSFFAVIRANGVFNAMTNDKLSGTTVNNILTGELQKKALPWKPAKNDRFLEAMIGMENVVYLQNCAGFGSSCANWAKLEAGLIFPYTEDKAERAAYLEQVKLRLKQIMAKYGENFKD